ncbi:phosphoribosylformylglycinamidine synthase [Marchantia polymorpha subsp. ruderalis]|uniref:phosphoribosylformylglycinamidine synthase n=2 Tax=Marchantia polymorpha TaxID=3197 RepID=A0A176W4C9_MARPO|nr:hypothetical protein AXG93_2015s1190 [Marchantia polymorpha subsp. ruderalis]PTQ39048.1 hypothetical protein MARPO_0047s0031 [Marchantia polymorpha]BBN14710.1 hypothetical protein Mp_6g13800 [Marchantia polymorpha subsp. ruderalis]|eukprot:PTQ39048.1 hypothetical protein MARPO_0047s0031 [Marchantia polymorpha]
MVGMATLALLPTARPTPAAGAVAERSAVSSRAHNSVRVLAGPVKSERALASARALFKGKNAGQSELFGDVVLVKLPEASKRPFSKICATLASKESLQAKSESVGGIDTKVQHLYRQPFLAENATEALLRLVKQKVSGDVESIKTEQCYNIALRAPISREKQDVLTWLLRETYEPDQLQASSFLDSQNATGGNGVVVEVGPRLSFTTAWSANAVSIFSACALPEVSRIERSRRYLLSVRDGAAPLDQDQLEKFAELVHDRMTECVYYSKLETFETDTVPEPVIECPVLEKGRAALEEINIRMGLAFDDFDLEYYTNLFQNDMKRNPTNVELFDIAQSNSEHSRHWFFKGELILDGQPAPKNLMDLVKDTLRENPNNSVIGFNDNSSAIRGRVVEPLRPSAPGTPSPLSTIKRDLDILFTAETHNFPCAVAPFPGAETGAGGRIRDTHATGIGSLIGASTAGYCVGNLQMEDSFAPWEDNSFEYPSNLASPLQILLDASDGASDYGNKFGEPLIQGYTRTFGMRLLNGERREWLKPIMFSAGIGQIDHQHLKKEDPEVGMLVVKIGGPAYRIGMGGGAASSMVSGQNNAELDFNAVQRGDAEMSQKLYRVVRTCVEMGDKNPIVSIHDQGAGGNCNVVKEIIYPKGAEIDVRAVVVGDKTMSVLEIWGAEYQEQDALLIRPENESLLRSICARERVSMAVLGSISGSGRVVLVDSEARKQAAASGLPEPRPAVDLDLEKVLGDMPRKNYHFTRAQPVLEALDIAPGSTVFDALNRVFHLPSVCSKRFLTSKVDRCVSGLVAQQQTVGPLQLPLADVAVYSQTYTGISGGACSIGEQPLKGLLDAKAMARLALGESLTNLVWAKVTALKDVKASGNWMYAAKLDGEGAAMYDAAEALREAMIALEVAIDGGKDSLSMAAQAGGETVKCPGNLVISSYVTCPDITKTVTPDLKLGDEGVLLHIDLARGKRRLGGSALAQVYDQIGDVCPDVDIHHLKAAFNAVQVLLDRRAIAAGHDISDGGIITALSEMAFAGNCGIVVDLPSPADDNSQLAPFSTLFAEELGLLLEVKRSDKDAILAELEAAGVTCSAIGKVTSDPKIVVSVDGEVHVDKPTSYLRDLWEETSFTLEKLQRLESCVEQEQQGLKDRTTPTWELSFTPSKTDEKYMNSTVKPKVAIIREEGSNGDREMSAMVLAAGFEPWDVAMSDLLAGKASLKDYKGIVFVGGFSYADVLDSAKGWAGTIRFNEVLLEQFQEFYNRSDTFSLGVCNGCQLMALLGWVPGADVGGTLGAGGDTAQPRFVHNESGRFECRFSSVRIEKSPALMLQGMEGTKVGVWVAHGEGRVLFPDAAIRDVIEKDSLAPIRYCDDSGEATEAYPFNPNGSPQGIAALCSPDGRHLALMPHPERCFMMWQFPWYPQEWSTLDRSGPSPWLKMFQNAREWCDQ